jgi:acyl-[acyl carrier protein]--UDP-N-acetylglucosamine O-acyltransferase
VIGDDNLIMGSCHIAHDCRLGNHNILANGTLLGGHVMVKDYVHTGGAVAVHQFCHIDSYSFLAGGSMVSPSCCISHDTCVILPLLLPQLTICKIVKGRVNSAESKE